MENKRKRNYGSWKRKGNETMLPRDETVLLLYVASLALPQIVALRLVIRPDLFE